MPDVRSQHHIYIRQKTFLGGPLVVEGPVRPHFGPLTVNFQLASRLNSRKFMSCRSRKQSAIDKLQVQQEKNIGQRMFEQAA